MISCFAKFPRIFAQTIPCFAKLKGNFAKREVDNFAKTKIFAATLLFPLLVRFLFLFPLSFYSNTLIYVG